MRLPTPFIILVEQSGSKKVPPLHAWERIGEKGRNRAYCVLRTA